MKIKSTKNMEKELEDLIEDVRLDFPELDKIPIWSGYSNDALFLQYETFWDLSPVKGKIKYLLISASTDEDKFFNRSKDEKKAVIAHELGHNVTTLGLEYSFKIKNFLNKSDYSDIVLAQYRKAAYNVLGDPLEDVILEDLFDDLMWDPYFKFSVSNELTADSEAVDRGYGEGLLSVFKDVRKDYPSLAELLLYGDPSLDIRIEKIEKKI